MTDTVIELDINELNPLQRKQNKELMIAFINHDIVNRAHLDVRDSIVLYNQDRTFTFATDAMPSADQLKGLFNSTNVRFWSKGC